MMWRKTYQNITSPSSYPVPLFIYICSCNFLNVVEYPLDILVAVFVISYVHAVIVDLSTLLLLLTLLTIFPPPHSLLSYILFLVPTSKLTW